MMVTLLERDRVVFRTRDITTLGQRLWTSEVDGTTRRRSRPLAEGQVVPCTKSTSAFLHATIPVLSGWKEKARNQSLFDQQDREHRNEAPRHVLLQAQGARWVEEQRSHPYLSLRLSPP